MAYKLLAIDLDGTLLTTGKEITPAGVNALAGAMDAGLHIIIASGRPYISIVKYLETIDANNYIISSAGAQIHDSNGKMVHSCCVDPAKTKEILNWCKDRGLHCQVYKDNGFYYIKESSFAALYAKHNGITGFAAPGLEERGDIMTPKILIIDEPERIKKIKAEIRNEFPELTVLSSTAYYAEILDPSASKANALEWVAGTLGVSPGEIIAFGDNEIDLSMLEYAGFSVAVSNSIPAVIAAADYVTDSNNDDGVANAIHKLVLNNKRVGVN